MRTRPIWVLVAMLAVAVVLAGCSGGGQPAATTPEQPAPAGTEAPAATPAEPAPSSAPVAMGTPATASDWTLTVKEAEREDKAGGAAATGGNEMLVIKFDLTNGGAQDAGVGPTDFKLADQNGTEYQAAPTNDPTFIFNIEQPIKAGTTREILIAYEVPKGTGPFNWTYEPFVEGGTTPVVMEVK
jgi:hypothetical protein